MKENQGDIKETVAWSKTKNVVNYASKYKFQQMLAAGK